MTPDTTDRSIFFETLESRALLSAGGDARAMEIAAARAAFAAARGVGFHPPAEFAPAQFDAAVQALGTPVAHGELPPGWTPPIGNEPPARLGNHRHPGARGDVPRFFGMTAGESHALPQAIMWRSTIQIVIAGFAMPPAPPIPDEVLEQMRAAIDAIRAEAPVDGTALSAATSDAPIELPPRERIVEAVAPSTADSRSTLRTSAQLPMTSDRAASGLFAAEPSPSLLDRAAMELAAIVSSSAIDLRDAPVERIVVAGAVRVAEVIVLPAAQTVGPGMFYFPRLGSASSFMFDSIAALTDEFAMIDAAQAVTWPTRAALVTAAVVAADVVLLTYLFRRPCARRGVRVDAVPA